MRYLAKLGIRERTSLSPKSGVRTPRTAKALRAKFLELPHSVSRKLSEGDASSHRFQNAGDLPRNPNQRPASISLISSGMRRKIAAPIMPSTFLHFARRWFCPRGCAVCHTTIAISSTGAIPCLRCRCFRSRSQPDVDLRCKCSVNGALRRDLHQLRVLFRGQ